MGAEHMTSSSSTFKLAERSPFNTQIEHSPFAFLPIHPAFSSFDYTPAARMFSRRLLVFVALQALPLVAQTATPPPEELPVTIINATEAALRQASAYQQAVIDEQSAAPDVTQARGALLPRLRSSSTGTFNKPLHPGSTDPSFIAANATREYQELVGVEGTLGLAM